MSTDLVGYRLQSPNPEFRGSEGQLYNYVFAANGIFIQAERDHLQLRLPLVECEIRGLTKIVPFFSLKRPRVPAAYLKAMLDLSMSVCVERGEPTEALFHLIWLEKENRWRLDQPPQEATGGSVKPLDDGPDSSYELALIEVHSHHHMDAFFSATDDADEQGFRIYGVIGNIFSEPKIRVRAGCFGNFFDIPADTIFEMPSELTDAKEAE